MLGRARVLLAVLALAILVGVAIATRLIPSDMPAGGPLAVSDPTTLEYEFPDGRPTTWGITLPGVAGNKDGALVSIHLVGLHGLDVLGEGVCDLAVAGCNVINAAGWPPAEVTPSSAEGAALGGARPLQLLIGVARTGGQDPGSITSVRLTYSVDGQTYDVTEPWSLRLFSPGTMPDPS